MGPNFGFEKREPKVANGKEEFADQIEINEEIEKYGEDVASEGGELDEEQESYEEEEDAEDDDNEFEEEESESENESQEENMTGSDSKSQNITHMNSSKIATEKLNSEIEVTILSVTFSQEEPEDYESFLQNISSGSKSKITHLRTHNKEQAMIKDIFDVDVEVDEYAGYEFEPDHEIRREKEILKAEVDDKIRRLKEQKQAEINARIAEEEKLQKIREEQQRREKDFERRF